MDTGDQTYAFLTPANGQRGSLAAQVADQLRGAIVSLRIAPGTMLDKAEICARLGVSRSPVAEAFARLQAEGLLDILPQRGSIVSLVSISAVREYVFIRKALEGEAARALAETCTPTLIGTLEDNIAGQRESAAAEDRDAFHLLDQQFHETLVGALPFPRMKAVVDTARNNLDRARQMTNSMRRIAVGIEEHAGIVAAVKSRDSAEAAARMHRHLDGIVAEIEGLATRRPELFAERTGGSGHSIHDSGTIRRLPSA